MITEFVFLKEYPWETKRSAIFTRERLQEGEKHGFLYACAEYYLQPNTVGWHCAWEDHYLLAVIGRSRGGLLANEKKKKFAMNDNINYCSVISFYFSVKVLNVTVRSKVISNIPWITYFMVLFIRWVNELLSLPNLGGFFDMSSPFPSPN